MSNSKQKLTAQQELFAREYVIDNNAKQAAIRAGYSEKTAQEQGSRLLSNVKVLELVETHRKKREIRTDVTADRVIKELAKIAFSDLNEFVEVSKDGKINVKPSDQVDGTVLSEISESVTTNGRTKKVKLHDKMKALELIGRHLAMFTDKQEIKIDKTVEENIEAVNQLKELRKKTTDENPAE